MQLLLVVTPVLPVGAAAAVHALEEDLMVAAVVVAFVVFVVEADCQNILARIGGSAQTPGVVAKLAAVAAKVLSVVAAAVVVAVVVASAAARSDACRQ